MSSDPFPRLGNYEEEIDDSHFLHFAGQHALELLIRAYTILYSDIEYEHHMKHAF